MPYWRQTRRRGKARPIWIISSIIIPSAAPSREGSSRSSSVWAASGARNGASGSSARASIVTAVGYAGGTTENPSYEQVCTGRTGHAEVVLVVFDPARISFETLLRTFWESHDPTQGDRQGNDIGTQYRSAIFCYSDEQLRLAEASRRAYGAALRRRASGRSRRRSRTAPPFYYAEAYHQQYLAKNPDGYCGLGGTGVACPTGLGAEPA